MSHLVATGTSAGTEFRPYLHVVFLALLFTLLNAVKPLHMDDPIYYDYATEFARHPLNPYDFSYGSPHTIPGNHLLVPPVLPYWWGLGLTLLGNQPVLWKLWLFPFALLLSGSLWGLYRRFAPGLAVPLLWMTVLSPALLPSFNYMLEVPVLALGLTALVLAMRAVERDFWRLTILVGLLAGVALQTKYTALVTLAVIVVWYVLMGHWRKGFVAAALALLVFVAWETFVVATQGESHFLCSLGQRSGGTVKRALHQALPLLTLVGGVAPAVALLGLTALGWSRRWVVGVAVAVLLGFVALAAVPTSSATLLSGPNGQPWLTLSNLVYGLLSALVWGTTAVAVYRLWRPFPGEATGVVDRLARRMDQFLLLWLVLEVGGFFALSPFPAVRRVLGVVLVVTLLAGRLASRTCWTSQRRMLIRGTIVAGISLGCFFFGIDWLEARAAQRAAQLVAGRNWELAPGRTHWYLSWWGFGHYAERGGLKPLVLDRSPPQPGDVITVHDNAVLCRVLEERKAVYRLELLDTITVGDPLRLHTVPCYYDGRTPAEHGEAGRITLRIFRVLPPVATQAARL